MIDKGLSAIIPKIYKQWEIIAVTAIAFWFVWQIECTKGSRYIIHTESRKSIRADHSKIIFISSARAKTNIYSSERNVLNKSERMHVTRHTMTRCNRMFLCWFPRKSSCNCNGIHESTKLQLRRYTCMYVQRAPSCCFRSHVSST